jgi:hypothetical protein
MRRFWLEVLLCGALTAPVLGCGDTTAPDLGTLAYEVFSGCIPDVFNLVVTCAPQQTTVARGDSLLVGHLLIDTSAALAATARLRPSCAVNFEIRHGGALVGTLPVTPTCSDSVQNQGDNPPRVYNAHVFFWQVPADAAQGTYTIKSVWLVDPALTRSIQVTVQ